MAEQLGYEQSELYRIRHTAAHILAQAVLDFYPEAKLGIGPPIADGFYYDFDLGTDSDGKPVTFSPDDLSRLTQRMRQIITEGHPLVYREVDAAEARALFADQPYKLELIDGLAQGQVDENGQPLAEPGVISTYRQGTFEDLCRGPHVMDTGQVPLDGFMLMSIAGAYWRGNEKRPMLQRIYGTAWISKTNLDAYLHRLAEARRRDHRRLGKQLELFHFDETAPGMPYWLPNGMKVLNTLIDFWREEHVARDYQEIGAPLVNDLSLWHTSGHWEYYRENMFIIPVDEQHTMALKPMNCPNAMLVFGLKTRSYRDLPLRLADTDTLHRRERAGTMHGLLRVQMFTQDDAHIFLMEEQIEAEYGRVFDLVERFYSVFGLNYRLRLGTRPDKFIGDLATWGKAEAALRHILDNHAGMGDYEVLHGDGAFYGPKVDILMSDALGREWQMGTIQLDFQLPRRFGLSYTDSNGQEQTPVVIHRVIYGSLERFIGLIIEHFNGAFPLWLAPVQAVVIPITDAHNAYAHEVAGRLKRAKLRMAVDDSNGRMQAKIRAAQMVKAPYMLIIGDQERAAGTVALRDRNGRRQDNLLLDDFIAMAAIKIVERSLVL